VILGSNVGEKLPRNCVEAAVSSLTGASESGGKTKNIALRFREGEARNCQTIGSKKDT